MSLTKSYKVNERQIAQERFDDEVLVVNLDQGIYYSMPALSASVWTWLSQGVSPHDAAVHLRATCPGAPDTIEAEVEDFVGQLVAHRLILPDDDREVAIEDPQGSQRAYAPLKLDVFTDMQDLLLLDPIHDVEEAGWPLAKPSS